MCFSSEWLRDVSAILSTLCILNRHNLVKIRSHVDDVRWVPQFKSFARFAVEILLPVPLCRIDVPMFVGGHNQ